MAKAKAAPSFAVKVAVWVMKPGPMAEVAIRKIAAMKPPRAAAEAAEGEVTDSAIGLLLLQGWSASWE
ncbi:hypothetical protein PDE01_13290 [Paracoccus denitrificans]|nr:hypothetical protein PDE01_13290 [Paracoccus denitrificans]